MWRIIRLSLAIALCVTAAGCAPHRKAADYNAFTINHPRAAESTSASVSVSTVSPSTASTSTTGAAAEPTAAASAQPTATTDGGAGAASASPSEPPSRDEHDLVVGSWNIKWFGKSKPSKYDFVTMADFVEECEVVAIQELSGSHYKECMDDLVSTLGERGRTYQYVVSEETGYKQNPVAGRNDYIERYGFIWNADRMRKKGEAHFVSTPEINDTTYRQVPFVADFETTGGDGFDFRLMCVHTVYNDDINDVRRAEIEAIGDWIVSESQGAEHDVIAVGDFNANPPGQPHHFAELIPDETRFRVLLYESRDAGEETIRTTVPTKDTSNDPDYFKTPVYDQMLVSNETSSALPANPMTRAAGVMGVYAFDDDPWWKENGWTRSEIISAVSDHRPVWFKMDYEAADLDAD